MKLSCALAGSRRRIVRETQPFAAGCRAFTSFLPTGDLLCPRWCITYKKGRSNGRHGCFGRMRKGEIQPTVVGRAEPHNLRLIHPRQDRVVTIRENARCQACCAQPCSRLHPRDPSHPEHCFQPSRLSGAACKVACCVVSHT